MNHYKAQMELFYLARFVARVKGVHPIKTRRIKFLMRFLRLEV